MLQNTADTSSTDVLYTFSTWASKHIKLSDTDNLSPSECQVASQWMPQLQHRDYNDTDVIVKY